MPTDCCCDQLCQCVGRTNTYTQIHLAGFTGFWASINGTHVLSANGVNGWTFAPYGEMTCPTSVLDPITPYHLIGYPVRGGGFIRWWEYIPLPRATVFSCNPFSVVFPAGSIKGWIMPAGATVPSPDPQPTATATVTN